MIIPRKDKAYFYPPFFDISCFWQESTGLSHKVRVYIPFETTMTFTPFLGVMVNRKQFEYFSIEDNPMRKPNAKLLSDEDAESVIAWIKLNRVALLQHWFQEWNPESWHRRWPWCRRALGCRQSSTTAAQDSPGSWWGCSP